MCLACTGKCAHTLVSRLQNGDQGRNSVIQDEGKRHKTQAGEVAYSRKHLPCSIPRSRFAIPGWERNDRQISGAHRPASLAYLVSSGPVGDPTLKR